MWGLVNKRVMKRAREERYDLSLTRTGESGLGEWLAVMGESREVGDVCLTEQLRAVVGECKEELLWLVVSDMPKEKPSK